MPQFYSYMRGITAAFFFAVPAGVKFVSLFILSLFVFYTHNILIIYVLCICSVLLYYLAGFTLRQILRSVWLFAVFAVLLAVFQYVAVDKDAALLAGGRLFSLLSFAAFVTKTASAFAIMAVTERFFHKFAFMGVKAHKITLAMALTLRFLPLIRQSGDDLRAARQARCGAEKLHFQGIKIFITAWLLRIVFLQEQMAEAMEARAFDDETE